MNARPISEFKEISKNQAQRHRDAAVRTRARAADPRIRYPQILEAAATKHVNAANLIDAAVDDEIKNSSKNLLEEAQKVALAADKDALIAMRRNNQGTAFAPLTNQAAGIQKKTKNHRKKTHKNKSRKSHRRKSKKQRKTKRRRRKSKKQRKTRRSNKK